MEDEKNLNVVVIVSDFAATKTLDKKNTLTNQTMKGHKICRIEVI